MAVMRDIPMLSSRRAVFRPHLTVGQNFYHFTGNRFPILPFRIPAGNQM